MANISGGNSVVEREKVMSHLAGRQTVCLLTNSIVHDGVKAAEHINDGLFVTFGCSPGKCRPLLSVVDQAALTRSKLGFFICIQMNPPVLFFFPNCF